MRPPIRLAALMEQPVIYVFTHDSIGLGEDGPTHQPIEQLSALRAIPNLLVHPPGRRERDRRGVARRARRRRDGPVALVLTRQKLGRHRPRDARPRPPDWRAAPTCSPRPEGGEPQVVLMSAPAPRCTIALAARERLAEDGIARARREHAVPGAVRAAGRSLPRRGAARRRAARGDGGGEPHVVVPLGARPAAPCSGSTASAPVRPTSGSTRSSG